LPKAISKRTIELPSSFWNAFTLQPGSTTITLIGRQSISAARRSTASMMRLARSRVMAGMASSRLWSEVADVLAGFLPAKQAGPVVKPAGVTYLRAHPSEPAE
jgi:hypothetical protein